MNTFVVKALRKSSQNLETPTHRSFGPGVKAAKVCCCGPIPIACCNPKHPITNSYCWVSLRSPLYTQMASSFAAALEMAEAQMYFHRWMDFFRDVPSAAWVPWHFRLVPLPAMPFKEGKWRDTDHWKAMVLVVVIVYICLYNLYTIAIHCFTLLFLSSSSLISVFSFGESSATKPNPVTLASSTVRQPF